MPPVEGKDAERMIEQLKRTAPPEEIEHRRREALQFLEYVSTPKPVLPPRRRRGEPR